MVCAAKHRGSHMQGVITGRDVVRHSFTIIRLWGFPTYVRCLRGMLRRRSCTFLEVLYEGERYPS